jgi:predicted phage-related endonuclease
MAFQIIRSADRQDGWHNVKKGIGSSEVAQSSVLTLGNPYQLWRRKKGLSPRVEENEAMRAGHILESAVATYFEEESGRQVNQGF